MNAKKKRDDGNPFANYLSPGESILWMDKPNPLWLLSPRDLLLIPFSLMWGGFAIFWEASALLSGAPLLFMLWGVPFVLIGQYFIWGRFLHKYFRRQVTYYALTERRVLILNKFLGRSLKAYFLHQFSALHRQGRSVLFDFNYSMMNRRLNWQDWSGEAQPGFYALSNPDEVYNLMQDLIVPSKPKNDWS